MLNGIHDSFRRAGLVRPRREAVIAGVCAGVARRIGLGPVGTRVLFIVTLIVIPGSQILVYPLLWILMPKETAQPTYGTPMA